jgi:hypothetical protein
VARAAARQKVGEGGDEGKKSAGQSAGA